VLLTPRENADFTAEQYSELFTEFFAIVDLAGLVLSPVIMDNLPAQSSGLDRALFEAHSPVIHIHCLAHMANLKIFAHCFNCELCPNHTRPFRNTRALALQGGT
jgi:hypothetical protein